VDSKAEYSAVSSTNSQKKIYKKEETTTNTHQCPFNSVQVLDPWRQSERSCLRSDHFCGFGV